MSARPSPDDFGHFHELATRWSDCDALGHVNNARYFTFDESARLDYFADFIAREPGFWREGGFILAHISCDFIEQLHHPSQIRFGFRVRRIGRSSMNTEGGLFVGERLIALTRGVLVWFNYAENRAMPVPEHARAYIRGKERLAPEEAG